MKSYSKQVIVFILSFTIGLPTSLLAQDTTNYDYSNRAVNHVRAMAPTQENFLAPDSPVKGFFDTMLGNSIQTATMGILTVLAVRGSNQLFHRGFGQHIESRKTRMNSVFGNISELLIINDDNRLRRYINQRYLFGKTNPATPTINSLFQELSKHIDYRPRSNDFILLATNEMLPTSRVIGIVQCLQFNNSPEMFRRIEAINYIITQSNKHLAAAAIHRYGHEILREPNKVGLQLSVLKSDSKFPNLEAKIKELETGHSVKMIMELIGSKGESTPRFQEFTGIQQKLEYDSARNAYRNYSRRVAFARALTIGSIYLLGGYMVYVLTNDHDGKVTANDKYNLTPETALAMYETDHEQLDVLFTEDEELERGAAMFADLLKQTDREVRQFDQWTANLEKTQVH